jgi:hypothetical protein
LMRESSARMRDVSRDRRYQPQQSDLKPHFEHRQTA